MSAQLHRHSPDLGVIDPRGAAVRQVAYHRTQIGERADARVTLSRHDASGRRVRQWDPRLSARHAEDPAVAPSQATLTSLSGQLLIEENADAGWRLIMPGMAGEPRRRWDARTSHWTHDYDEQLRPLAVRESAGGTPPRIAERFTWGGAWEQTGNRCGRLIRHDDDAGSLLLQGYDLNGQVTDEIRHFLADLALPDWPVAQTDRDALLEPGDGAPTHYRHGPLNDLQERTDAEGNLQRWRLNRAGELTGLNLVLADGSDHPLLVDARYNAQGQVETRTSGNGVISHAEYDPANARLVRLSARRPRRGTLQDLRYEHDPVGNVLSVEDLAQPTRHFANQKIVPVSTFAYDTLYQLTQASGREVNQGASHGPALPGLENLPVDPSRMANYTQQYEYDAAGNLLHLRHLGAQPFTRDYRIADDSNRSLPPELTDTGFDQAFDGNGNLRLLLPGQPLTWNARNQLHRLDTLVRDQQNDGEHYRYDGSGQRCRKTSLAKAQGRTLVNDVRYLPGLELRRTATGEVLHVITCQVPGGDVRLLHWQEGKPDGIDNDPLRYSLADHLGSGTLELDRSGALISQELYYPFGGTACWAGRSAVEASYKTHRYSGRERDASGLYDYGWRYYAPWLQRWICPDPAGDVDGLNRYRMVGNNPIGFVDEDGLVKKHPISARIEKSLQKLQLSSPVADDAPPSPMQQDDVTARRKSDASSDTSVILALARRNSWRLKNMDPRRRVPFGANNPEMMTEKRLHAAAAHASISWGHGGFFRSGFTNLPGSLGERNTFPGVRLLPAPSRSLTIPPAFAHNQSWGFYAVSNLSAMISGIKQAYIDDESELHPYTERRIRRHLEKNNYRLPVKAGIPGLHAEVVGMNTRLNLMTPEEDRNEVLRDLIIFTERLVAGKGQQPGTDFTACYNCDGIIPKKVRIPTGRGATPEPSPTPSRASSPARSSR